MSFSENLKLIRKDKNITQEQLAELLDVSRQAISKWESGNGYPETEKLLLISKKLNVSLDYLLLDDDKLEAESSENKSSIIIPSGKISIRTSNGSNVISCHAVKSSSILFTRKNEPKYILLGIDSVTFWGEHTTILGWYASLDDIENEIEKISNAIQNGEVTYKLEHASDIEFVGFFGQPKLKEIN